MDAASSDLAPLSRPARQRWYRSTWVVVFLTAIVLLLVEVPGRYRRLQNGGMTTWSYWSNEEWLFAHGWPVDYLVRETGDSSYPSWRLTEPVREFSPAGLVLDLLVAAALLVAVGRGAQRWRRGRNGLARFSLREALLLTFVAATACGWLVHRQRRAAALQAALATLHCNSATFEADVPDWLSELTGDEIWTRRGLIRLSSRTELERPTNPDERAALRTLLELQPDSVQVVVNSLSADDVGDWQSLESLVFSVNDSTKFAELARLRSLRELTVVRDYDDNGTEAVFPVGNLVGLTRLQFLRLIDFAPLGDAEIEWIAQIRGLEVLGFRGLAASAAGLARLTGLEHLRSLSIVGPGVDDRLLDALGRMRGLESLYLTDGEFTDAGATSLAQLTELRDVGLESPLLTEAGLAALKELRALRRLYLVRCDIRQLDQFGPDTFPQLEHLDLRSTSVGDAQVRAFKLSHPGCQVDFEPEGPIVSKFLTNVKAVSNGGSRLYIGNSKICGKRLDVLAELPALRELSVSGNRLRDDDMGRIARATGLEELSLNQVWLNPRGVEALQSLPKLTNLSVINAPLADDTARQLGKMTTLKRLDITNSRFSLAGLRSLASLSRLETLDISFTSTTDAGVAALAPLAALKSLNLWKTLITDDCTDSLLAHPELVELNLRETKITAVGLRNLSGLKHLRTLVIGHDLLEAGGLDELRRFGALRELKVNGISGLLAIDNEEGARMIADIKAQLPQVETVTLGY